MCIYICICIHTHTYIKSEISIWVSTCWNKCYYMPWHEDKHILMSTCRRACTFVCVLKFICRSCKTMITSKTLMNKIPHIFNYSTFMAYTQNTEETAYVLLTSSLEHSFQHVGGLYHFKRWLQRLLKNTERLWAPALHWCTCCCSDYP